jgi:hypothetical protein
MDQAFLTAYDDWSDEEKLSKMTDLVGTVYQEMDRMNTPADPVIYLISEDIIGQPPGSVQQAEQMADKARNALRVLCMERYGEEI